MDGQIFFSFGKTEFKTIIGEAIQEKLSGLQPQSQPITKNNDERFASRQQVAEALKISLPTLNDYTKNGKLKSYRIGNRVLYKWDEVEESLSCITFNNHRP